MLQEALSYDDILLQPKFGIVDKRANVSLQTWLGPHYPLDTPIVSAPMSTVTEWAMAQAMYDAGGTGVIHRFMPIRQQAEEYHKSHRPVFCAVGLNEGLERVDALLAMGCSWICVDVAHAHSARVAEFVKTLPRDEINTLMIGNVSTYDGARFLADLGADCIKVGIGPGSACTTRLTTGFGTPQFTAIQEASRARARADYKIRIVADGGIKNSGDAVKAFVAGADAVMLGYLLAGAEEAAKPGEFYGMASHKAMRLNGKTHEAAEGSEGEVTVHRTVAEIVKELNAGIRSGISYGGGRTIPDIQGKVDYYIVSASSHHESRSRI